MASRGKTVQLSHMFVADFETCDERPALHEKDYPNQKVWLAGLQNRVRTEDGWKPGGWSRRADARREDQGSHRGRPPDKLRNLHVHHFAGVIPVGFRVQGTGFEGRHQQVSDSRLASCQSCHSV